EDRVPGIREKLEEVTVGFARRRSENEPFRPNIASPLRVVGRRRLARGWRSRRRGPVDAGGRAREGFPNFFVRRRQTGQRGVRERQIVRWIRAPPESSR